MNQTLTAMARPSLLDHADLIDARWLTAALRQAGYHDAEVESFACKPIGAGNVSDTQRIALTYRGPTDAPASVVCKFRASSDQAHAHGIGSGSYYREVNSYRVIGQSCRTPRLYWLAGGRENINLMMEDMTGIARPGDQIAGCSGAEAAAVVAELARLHRSFLPMPREQKPEWAMTMAETADYWTDCIDRALPLIREHVADRLSARELATAEAAQAIAADWYRLPVTRGTLTHGDPRVDNILFLDAPEGVRAVLLDWQMTGWRGPMQAVGYLLSGSVTVEDRRAHEGRILADYAAHFGADYPLEQVRADYRLQLLSGLLTTIAAYALLPLDNEAVDLLLLTLLRRNLAAAMDWESIPATRLAHG